MGRCAADRCEQHRSVSSFPQRSTLLELLERIAQA
jgi:hypothetical protein